MKTRHLAMVVVLSLTAPAVAAAQPSATQETEPPKDPGKAIGLAALGIVGGIGLTFLGAAFDEDRDDELGSALGLTAVGLGSFGPSAGHAYAGAWGIAAATSLARVAGVALLLAGVSQLANHDDGEGGGTYLLGGAILWLGATIFDFVDAPFAAKRANRAWLDGRF